MRNRIHNLEYVRARLDEAGAIMIDHPGYACIRSFDSAVAADGFALNGARAAEVARLADMIKAIYIAQVEEDIIQAQEAFDKI